ncbi:protein AF1q [Takifugu rubripes]|uniref:protein AF1q n=1 Tax=Takifugu rubripes TaxID=31033 RepID=UPI0005D29B09|nr:protein AF1q [Takifugu rubripes]|eukprot:XP_011607544.1 PREDICTED: protein AF1q [Takifugu rubripes]
MMDRSSSQYDSFLFWRQPIPELDLSELEDLGLTEEPARSAAGKDDSCQEEEDFLSQFTSFTFWRAPLADVDSLLAGLNLLL